VVLNEKTVYKNLLMERSTPEQQSSVADSEFIELDGVPVENIQSIPEENEESHVELLTLQTKVRQSTRPTKAQERCSYSLHYLLLTDSGEPECYEEALQVKAKDK